MNARWTFALLAGLALAPAPPARAQAPRLDVIWARTTDGAPITLDGVLDEPAWAQAESYTIRYARDNGRPGSGWKDEIIGAVTDSMTAVLKFLVNGNQVYLGAFVQDRSVGGGPDFNYFDGFLMAVKDRSTPARPAGPAEYTYTWWNYGDPDPTAPGKPPTFVGRWGKWPASTSPRDPASVAAWDAVTVVNGLSNSDAVLDNGYTVEMRFDAAVMGYNLTQPQGDIFEWNISIYDCDWSWPITSAISGNRTWWQSPWANAMWYNEVRVYTRPDVTVNSGPVPAVGPEYLVPNAASFPAPTIDGALAEQVWGLAPGFDIRYGDTALRDSYAAVGPWRSGQYQPAVNGGSAPILDPGDATVKWFFKDDRLYLGFDVRDQVVQNAFNLFDRWDGFVVTLNDYAAHNPVDHNLVPYQFSFHVGQNGTVEPADDLGPLVTSGDAQLGLALKPNTTAEDTASADVDEGYTAELALDLTALGYPAGLGDGTLFIGIDLLDGDSFDPFTRSYGTRTWWFRERRGECCPTWAYMDPSLQVVGVGEEPRPTRYALLGSFPNPMRMMTSIRYALPEASHVTLEVFDPQGRRVSTRALGTQPAGEQRATWNRGRLGAGLYLYRLRAADPSSGLVRATLSGKMMVVD